MSKKDYSSWDRKDLIKEVEKLRKRKKYGLVWEDKPEDVVEQCKSELPVLEEIKNKEIITAPDKPVNILIEGDNYHALSVLNYTHKGKIDVIYIDPPYNTGAKDWKYNNNYIDENDKWRHSKWLSFMEKRLKLAKNLLKKNGVLICTIDKNEQANLGVLLQEIFNDKEIVCVTIIHNPGGIQGKNFSHTNEFAYFIHPLNGNFISTIARDDVPQTAFRDWGKESSKREAAKTCFYPIFIKDESIIGFGDVSSDDFHPKNSNILRKDRIIEVYPVDQKGVERKWRFGRETVEDIKEELICKKIKGEYSILREKKDYRWKTVWTETKYNANVYGTKLLNNIIQAKFPYPKSLYAVMDCVNAVIYDKQNSIVLDFFAGSGTTGHAVLELNKQDGGNRKFILCTNNENRIAEEVTYPRIEKIINGYKYNGDKKEILLEEKITVNKLEDLDLVMEDLELVKEKNTKNYDKLEVKIEDNHIRLFGIKKVDGMMEGLGGNLKYFKTAFVTDGNNDKNKYSLTQKATEMLCLKEDTFDKVKVTKDYKIFKNQKKYTGILFEQSAMNAFKDEIRDLKGKCSVYVFSLGEEDFEEEFSDLDNKVKLSPIPEAILKVYRRIFKSKKN